MSTPKKVTAHGCGDYTYAQVCGVRKKKQTAEKSLRLVVVLEVPMHLIRFLHTSTCSQWTTACSHSSWI